MTRASEVIINWPESPEGSTRSITTPRTTAGASESRPTSVPAPSRRTRSPLARLKTMPKSSENVLACSSGNGR